MKRLLLIGHRANRIPASQETDEVGADVGGAILVPIDRKVARSLDVCIAAAPGLPPYPSPSPLPSTAHMARSNGITAGCPC